MRYLLIAFSRKIDSIDYLLTKLLKKEVNKIIKNAEDKERKIQAGYSA
jgi:hypothetical protein